jgi:cysteine dioxygenase
MTEEPQETLSVDSFIAGLCSIPEAQFKVGTVYEYIKRRPVERDSLEKYLFFDKKHYTRNLIFKNDLFEVLAICWDVGQVSAIHNHQFQNCWMTVPIGKLRVQNFRLVEDDEERRRCRLQATEQFDIHRLLPAEVDPAEPIHQVLNLPEFNEQAVSLHIYSRPYDRCMVYSLTTGRYEEVSLRYFSKFGQSCEE